MHARSRARWTSASTTVLPGLRAVQVAGSPQTLAALATRADAAHPLRRARDPPRAGAPPERSAHLADRREDRPALRVGVPPGRCRPGAQPGEGRPEDPRRRRRQRRHRRARPAREGGGDLLGRGREHLFVRFDRSRHVRLVDHRGPERRRRRPGRLLRGLPCGRLQGDPAQRRPARARHPAAHRRPRTDHQPERRLPDGLAERHRRAQLRAERRCARRRGERQRGIGHDRLPRVVPPAAERRGGARARRSVPSTSATGGRLLELGLAALARRSGRAQRTLQRRHHRRGPARSQSTSTAACPVRRRWPRSAGTATPTRAARASRRPRCPASLRSSGRFDRS